MERVRIEKLVHKGNGLGRLPGGKTVFVPLAAPGELVEIRIVEERSSWALAELESVLEASPDRREPPCPYFGACGGCQLQHMTYPAQMKAKETVLAETWRGRHPVEVMGTGPEFGYRHRVRFHVLPGARGLGFMRRGTNRLLPVEDCLLCAQPIRERLPWVLDQLLPELAARRVDVSELSLACGREGVAVHLHTECPLHPETIHRLREWSELPLGFDPPGLSSRPLTVDFGPHPMLVDAAGFFQANPAVVAQVFTDPALAVEAGDSVLELYCGVGLFTVPLARRARRVDAVEASPRCQSLFRRNLAANGAGNACFFQADAAEWVLRANLERYDMLFADPPRAGLGLPLARRLSEGRLRRLAYLSCEISTQQRDVQELLADPGACLARLALYDFFPNTYHMECLANIHGHH